MVIFKDLNGAFRIVTEMAYKYTSSVVDRPLRSFLVFMLVLMAVVAVTMAIQITYGVDVTTDLLNDLQVMDLDKGGYTVY